MKSAILICLFYVLTNLAFGLSSITDTELFILDTVAPSLNLISPNGGEEWYIGDTHNITWTATDTNMPIYPIYPIKLWYSLNGGNNYILLTDSTANIGSYSWGMPSSQSYNARVKIGATDSFGNFTQKSSNSPFSITYVPPKIPLGVNVNVSNNPDAVISWLPVTETIYNTPITPDGYIILYNETPYEDEHFYYFLGRSYTTNYTHHDVTEFRNIMFYKVKAYKNYSRSEADALDALCRRSGKEPIPWKDAQDFLKKGGTK
jgi:hypothetical protein